MPASFICVFQIDEENKEIQHFPVQRRLCWKKGAIMARSSLTKNMKTVMGHKVQTQSKLVQNMVAYFLLFIFMLWEYDYSPSQFLDSNYTTPKTEIISSGLRSPRKRPCSKKGLAHLNEGKKVRSALGVPKNWSTAGGEKY
jgi:hypothetical protein